MKYTPYKQLMASALTDREKEKYLERAFDSYQEVIGDLILARGELKRHVPECFSPALTRINKVFKLRGIK